MLLFEKETAENTSLYVTSTTLCSPLAPFFKWHETDNARTMAENSDAIFFLLPMNKVNTTNTRTRFRLSGLWQILESHKSVVSYFSGKIGTFIQ
jgi:hypothetical protein